MGKNNNDFFEKKKPWSEVKDRLLECYLKPYFSKILTTNKPVLYIDCFAGKGKFNDGKLGSPLIAKDRVEEALNSSKSKINNKIDMCLIESKHYNDLKVNMREYSNVKVIKGKFEDNICNILQGNRGKNIFMYIDPYGIRSLDFNVLTSFVGKNYNSIEFLLNLNSFGFIREACNAMKVKFDLPSEEFEDIIEQEAFINEEDKSIQALNIIAGGDYWQGIIAKYKNKEITGYEAEKMFVEDFCIKLKETYKYVLNMPIRINKNYRPKYRMIHATNHADGCILMNNNMYSRWEVWKDTQENQQMTLFSEDVDNNLIEDGQILSEVQQELKSYNQEVSINSFIASFISRYGVRCKKEVIVNIIKDLEKLNKVIVRREPEITQIGKKSRFWSEGNGKHVWIKSKKEIN